MTCNAKINTVNSGMFGTNFKVKKINKSDINIVVT